MKFEVFLFLHCEILFFAFTWTSSIMMERLNTLALFVGGEPHHGAATPRASCDRRADGGKAGNTPTATRPTFQITTSATSSAPTATATPGGQHHDGPRGTFTRPSSCGISFYRRRPSSFTSPELPQTCTGNSVRHFVGLSP